MFQIEMINVPASYNWPSVFDDYGGCGSPKQMILLRFNININATGNVTDSAGFNAIANEVKQSENFTGLLRGLCFSKL
jgi:hypothetical protein